MFTGGRAFDILISKLIGCFLCFPTCLGKLCDAAGKKEDEKILKHIRRKDCSYIEVHYHKSCYKDYVCVLKDNDRVVKKWVALLMFEFT